MASDNTSGDSRPIVLHIGDPVKYNPDLFRTFSSEFTVIRPSLEERQREEFMKALTEKRWGDFSAIFRPFWGTGGEMGRWDKELVPLLPASCKVFASAGAGFDWADVDLLAHHGIIYCNGASACVEAVADFTIFGILSTFRELTWVTQAARSRSSEEFMDCHDRSISSSRNPRGHILGIIGLGKIGYLVAKRARLAFGMKIVYYDVSRKSLEMEADVQAAFYPDLSNMLSLCDCVILATPGSPDGSKIISRAMISHFKPGSRFVNIARGGLVDEEALVEALESGKISAAMLDVHEHEPKVNEKLATMRNVTLSCHNAGGTLETHIGFERMAMENVNAVLKGMEPLSPVNQHLVRSKDWDLES